MIAGGLVEPLLREALHLTCLGDFRLAAANPVAGSRHGACRRTGQHGVDRMRLGRAIGREPATALLREDQRPRALAHERKPAGAERAVPELETNAAETARDLHRIPDEPDL